MNRYTKGNPNESPLYGGLAGVGFDVDYFDFGKEIMLSTTYAHLMAHFILAFGRAQPGQPHPAPWKVGGGGLSFDIVAELHIPETFSLNGWFDRLNTIWWVSALIRLRSTALLRVPAVAAQSFSEMAALPGDPSVWLMEALPSQLVPVRTSPEVVSIESLEWIREHWMPAGKLMREHDNFNIAFQAFDQCIWTYSPALALVQLWGAFERLFATSRHQKTFQLATRISAYLEAPGPERERLADHVKQLYEARSSCAHGTPTDDDDPLYETYSLLRDVLMRMIEADHVPSKEDLEALGPLN